MEQQTRVKSKLFDAYDRREEGGILYKDQEDVEAQRALIWAFVKEAGMHLMKGGSLTKIAMPVGLSQPNTFLQHIACEYACAPLYLGAAAAAGANGDFVERMIQVAAYVVSGLYRSTMSQKKPFNPILGETYQGSLYDGTRLYMEQISHHPPISAWDLEAPDAAWRFSGVSEGTASFGGNSVVTGRKGRQGVTFASDGATVSWTLPTLTINGVIYGARSMEYAGQIDFVDAQNALRATLVFDSDSVKGGWFGGGKKAANDLFRGAVFATNAGSAAGVEGTAAALAAASISSSAKAAAAPVHEALACRAGEVQCASFHGSWLEHFTVSASPALRRAAAAKAPQKPGKGAASAASAAAESGELRLWELGVHCGHDFINDAAPLPSDAVFRADVRALAAQNMPLAQSEKVRLENEQRADAKLRKAHGGGH